MDPNPINWCPFKKRKFGSRDRHAQRADDVEAERERTDTCKPRRGAWHTFFPHSTQRIQPADTGTLDLRAPEL